MIEPTRLSFEVDCPADHAFAVWTGRIDQWWPADHTASGEHDTTVVLEGRPGGRIFERTVSGIEHDWGEVTIWEPPTRSATLASEARPRRRNGGRDRVHRSGRRHDARRDRAPGLGSARGGRGVVARPESRWLGDPPAAFRRAGRRRATRLRALAATVPYAAMGIIWADRFRRSIARVVIVMFLLHVRHVRGAIRSTGVAPGSPRMGTPRARSFIRTGGRRQLVDACPSGVRQMTRQAR